MRCLSAGLLALCCVRVKGQARTGARILRLSGNALSLTARLCKCCLRVRQCARELGTTTRALVGGTSKGLRLVDLAEACSHGLESPGELGGHEPHLVRLVLCDLRQDLQV